MRDRRPPGIGPFGNRLALVLGLLLLMVATDFLRFAHSVADLGPPTDVSADGIVALTGGSARIDGALALLADNRADKLLISGVNPLVNRHDIAKAVEGTYRAALDQRVDLGRLARDTIGNADEARLWAERQGFRSLIVVTSDYHMPRSMVELERAMPNIKLIPYPVSNRQLGMEHWWRHAASVKLLASEYVKYTLARARLAFKSLRGAPQAAAAAGRDTAATNRPLR